MSLSVIIGFNYSCIIVDVVVIAAAINTAL